MLLSAFAYAHFVNLADAETREKPSAEAVVASPVLGSYNYKATDFFGLSNAMLTEFARSEIAEIAKVQRDQQLTISVPAVAEAENGERLRQWEKVAARSAAIADAFESAGQNGNLIVLDMPEKLVSAVKQSDEIKLTFAAPDEALLKN